MPKSSTASYIALFAVALISSLGASMAHPAPIIPDPTELRLAGGPTLIADLKAGINAGGLAGVDASVGKGGAKVGVGADVGSSDGAGANIDAGADAGAGAVQAEGAVGAKAATGGTNVGANSNVGADTAAGSANGEANVGANAGSSGVGASAGATADGGGVSAGVNDSTVTKESSVSGSATPSGGVTAAGSNSAAAPLAQTSTVLLPLLPPVLPLGGRERDNSSPTVVRETQLALLGCVDPLVDGPCPADKGATLGAIPQSKPQFQLLDSGAAKIAAAPTVQPTHGVATQSTAESFGISLEDPVRTRQVLEVRCILVNISSQAQTIPTLEVSLENSEGDIVGHSAVVAPVNALSAGEKRTFKLRIQPVPSTAARLTVSLTAPM